MAPPMEKKYFKGDSNNMKLGQPAFNQKRRFFSQKNSGHPWLLCFGKLETQLTLLM